MGLKAQKDSGVPAWLKFYAKWTVYAIAAMILTMILVIVFGVTLRTIYWVDGWLPA